MNIADSIKRHGSLIIAVIGLALLIFCLLPFTVAAFKPQGVLHKFMTDPSFWGNIIAALITLYLIRITINEGRLSRRVSLNQDIYTTEVYRLDYIKDLIAQVEMTQGSLEFLPPELTDEHRTQLKELTDLQLFDFVHAKSMTKQLQPEYAEDCKIYLEHIYEAFQKLKTNNIEPDAYKETLEILVSSHERALAQLKSAREKCQNKISECEAA